MEKYSAWRDEGTGIPPFLPERNTADLNIIRIIICWIKYLIVTLAGVVLIPFMGLGGFNRLRTCVLYSIDGDVQVDGLKRRQVRKNEHYPKKDGVYACNAISPFDATLLESVIGNQTCNFMIPREGELYSLTANEWFQFGLDGGLSWRNAKKIADVETFCQGKVNFVFVEGTTSNGKSILPFEINSSMLEDLVTKCGGSIQTVTLKINSKLTTPLKPKSVIRYKLAWLCVSGRSLQGKDKPAVTSRHEEGAHQLGRWRRI